MSWVLAAVDSDTGRFQDLVQGRLHTDMQDAINDGVETAVAAMPTVAQAVADRLAPLTADSAVSVLLDTATSTRGKLDGRYLRKSSSGAGRNGITGWFHVDDAGAKHDNTTDDRAVIQSVVDAANTAYLATGITQRVFFGPYAYRIGWTPYYNASGTIYGVTGILLKSGVELFGTGILRALDSSYGQGALLSIVRGDANGVSHVGIRDLTFDGRRATQVASQQSGNISIENAVEDIRVVNVTSYDANGSSILVAGTFSAPAKDVVIEDCRVVGASMIGIQVSQFDGLKIHHNIVRSTDNNAIDIYGENQGSTLSNGRHFAITDNQVSYASVGIFPETVAEGIVANNKIYNCGEGVHVNRINGAPEDILIATNHVKDCVVGMGFTGDTNGVTVRGNTIAYFNSAGFLLGGAGRVSNYYFLDNDMNGTNGQVALLLVKAGTNQSAHIVHRGTITRSTHREYDSVDYATTRVSNTYVAATPV